MSAQIVFLSTLLVLAVQLQATVVKQCDKGILPTVTVECPKGNVCINPPCNAILGQSIIMNVTFNSPYLLEHIKPKMMATAAGVTVQYPVGDNACEQLLNTVCPVAKGELVQYQLTIPVSSSFPQIPAALQFSIMDEDTNSAVVCAAFNVQVVK